MLKLTAKVLAGFLILYSSLWLHSKSNTSDKSLALSGNYSDEASIELQKLKRIAVEAKSFCKQRGYNQQVCFLIDMSLPSGKKRFFEYNIKEDSIISSGMVAHGSCNYSFLSNPQFSNDVGCGCTALGKYKVGYKYAGRFGAAYKLYGLDTSNNNAFKRFIVLHSYYMVPDQETYPEPVCNSLGCAMVSPNYLSSLAPCIDSSVKPVLLWIFN